ncbi:MAG: hypothetical protein GYA21_08035 [Myxococcales bacterium]|nr:hypothetical protein [Myxococcales bacterium]
MRCAVFMFFGVAAIGVLGVCCHYDPAYENLICAPGAVCPDGLTCDPVSKRCVRPGSEPALDGDGGPDAFDDGADAADGGPDDVGPDNDAGEDGQDGGGDGGPDTDPCGGCLPGRYCNEAASGGPACEQCVIQHHCGPQCLDCGDVLSCQHRGDVWCCFPESCGAPEQCLTGTCGDPFICASLDRGATWDWQAAREAGARFACALKDETGPVSDNRCYNSTNLQFHCPWDGTCQSGDCVLLGGVGNRLHACVFGCFADGNTSRCRRHLADGEGCLYNFDCESFCCSKAQSAVCIPYNEGNCRGMRTHHHCDMGGCDDTFVAKGPDGDRHNMSAWASVSGDSASSCSNDYDCDSQKCGSGSKKCTFYDTCVGNEPSDSSIRSTYFCAAPGGHAAHLAGVTDSTPEPQASECD